MMRLVPLLALVALACNTEPEGGEIRIDPGLPSTSDDLVLVIAEDAVDPNKKDVVDYQIAWTRDGEAVDVGQVVAQMQANSQLAREMVLQFIQNLPAKRSLSPIDHALEDAVITAPDQHDPALLAMLDAAAGRLLNHG